MWQAQLTMDSARGHVNDVSTLQGQMIRAGGIASDRALLSGGLRDKSLVAVEDRTEAWTCPLILLHLWLSISSIRLWTAEMLHETDVCCGALRGHPVHTDEGLA